MDLYRGASARPKGKDRRAAQPDRHLQLHIMRGRITLDELFVDGRDEQQDGDTLAKMRKVARCRLIGTFVHAKDPRDKKGTDGRIVGCGGTITELVQYVAAHMQHSHTFVRATDLPPQYFALNNHWREAVRSEAKRLLLTEVLLGTQPNQSGIEIPGLYREHIEYDEGLGHWAASSSLLAEYGDIRPQIADIVTPQRRPERKKGRA